MKLAIIHNVPTKKKNTINSAPDEDVLDSSKDIMKALGRNIDVFRFEKSLLQKLKEYDVIINFAEKYDKSKYREDEIAGYLEEHNIKFTGAGSKLLTLTMDKELIKEHLVRHNIRTPRHVITDRPIDINLNFPLIVKPCKEHASIGISNDSIVYDKESLYKKIADIKSKFSQNSLVEEYIEGREINASILGEEVLSLHEVIINPNKDEPRLITYDLKWDENAQKQGKIIFSCPAKIDSGLKKELENTALTVAKVFESLNYTRVDFRIKDNIPYVIDVNPNPCISTDSEFIRSAKATNYDYKYVIERIIDLAKK